MVKFDPAQHARSKNGAFTDMGAKEKAKKGIQTLNIPTQTTTQTITQTITQTPPKIAETYTQYLNETPKNKQNKMTWIRQKLKQAIQKDPTPYTMKTATQTTFHGHDNETGQPIIRTIPPGRTIIATGLVPSENHPGRYITQITDPDTGWETIGVVTSTTGAGCNPRDGAPMRLKEIAIVRGTNPHTGTEEIVHLPKGTIVWAKGGIPNPTLHGGGINAEITDPQTGYTGQSIVQPPPQN